MTHSVEATCLLYPRLLAAAGTVGVTPSGGILGYMTGGFFDDDYDPLAPMLAGEEACADSESLGSFGPGDEDDPLELGDVDDGGFGDGIVRIWVDDDGRLEKVRVSPYWFKKLQGSDTLAGSFNQAFQVAGMRLASPKEAELPDFDEELGELPEPTFENLRIVRLMIEENSRLIAAAAEEAAQLPAVPQRRLTGRHEGAIVVLDADGRPDEVRFDEAWLDEVQVGPLANAVMRAANKAYAQRVPSEPDPRFVALDDYQHRQELLLAGLFRMLNPKKVNP
ncbi:hypothetical protein [uncultured Tessaracoccus sp.]|uniref:hypothetical protein n=1 Tax=uncultured Tessaracoccus sp. TaxID=905023 RepID=UPI002619E599|nr:hypothetical protein [uncultured Tessaracoccus sp.]